MHADSTLHQPFLHTTPTETLEQSVQRRVAMSDRTFTIACPSNADKILNHPSTHEAFEADQYMPYWAELWPASQMLGEALIKEAKQQNWTADTTALELGCGVGLSGIVALSLGMHVIFSDYDAAAVAFAAENARTNGFNNFETLPLDWRAAPRFQAPLILAADVIYEERNISPLIQFIRAGLAPEGVCLLSDPDRSTRGGFRHALKKSDLSFSTQTAEAPGPENRTVKGSVYRITL